MCIQVYILKAEAEENRQQNVISQGVCWGEKAKKSESFLPLMSNTGVSLVTSGCHELNKEKKIHKLSMSF